MKFLKNIDNYLLKYFPTAWNMNFAYLFIILLILQLVFYLLGYISLIGAEGYTENISRFSLSAIGVSSAFLIISICGLILFVFMMMRYMSYKPFADLMPLKQGYFYTNLLLLMVLLFSFSMVYLNFLKGFNQRVRNEVPWEQLEKAQYTNEMVKPWLYSLYEHTTIDSIDIYDQDGYLTHVVSPSYELKRYLNIVNKQFPSPFPLWTKRMVSSLEENRYHKINQPQIAMEQATNTVTLDSNANSILYDIDETQPYYKIGSEYYQFGHLDSVQSLNTKCDSFILTNVVPLAGLGKVKEYSITNYAYQGQEGSEINPQEYYMNQSSILEKEDVHTMRDFLKEYNATNTLLGIKPLEGLENQAQTILDIENSNFKSIDTNLSRYQIDQTLAKQGYDIDAIYELYNTPYFLSTESFYYILLAVFFLSLLILLLKHIPIPTLVRSAVLVAILFVFNVFILMLSDGSGLGSVIYCLIILSLFLIFLFNQEKKTFMNWMLLPAIFSIYLIYILSYFLIRNSYISDLKYCGKLDESTLPIIFQNPNAWILLGSFILSSFVFYILKKWRATPD